MGEEEKKHKEATASIVPFKRFRAPDEVSNVALFLVSEESSYVSGSIYSVDGEQGTL